MLVCKPLCLAKLLKLSCNFGSHLPGSQGELGSMTDFVVCFLLKEKWWCQCFKRKRDFSFLALRMEVQFLCGLFYEEHRVIVLVIV